MANKRAKGKEKVVRVGSSQFIKKLAREGSVRVYVQDWINYWFKVERGYGKDFGISRRDSSNGQEVNRVKELKERLLGIDPQLYFDLQAEIAAIAQEDLLRQNAELRQTIDDLRQVNVKFDVATDQLGEIHRRVAKELKLRTEEAREGHRKNQERDKLILALLMPWAVVLGPAYLQTRLLGFMESAGLSADPQLLLEVQTLLLDEMKELLKQANLSGNHGDGRDSLEVLKKVATDFLSAVNKTFPKDP